MSSADEIYERFRYRPPRSDDRVQVHENARSLITGVAIDLNACLPEGREKALVWTKLEEALFWANAAIARQP